jgi:hypothetical protein
VSEGRWGELVMLKPLNSGFVCDFAREIPTSARRGSALAKIVRKAVPLSFTCTIKVPSGEIDVGIDVGINIYLRHSIQITNI